MPKIINIDIEAGSMLDKAKRCIESCNTKQSSYITEQHDQQCSKPAKKQRSEFLLLNDVDANYIKRRIRKGTIEFPYKCSLNSYFNLNTKIRFIGYLCKHFGDSFYFVDAIGDQGSLCLCETVRGNNRLTFTLEVLFDIIRSNRYYLKRVGGMA